MINIKRCILLLVLIEVIIQEYIVVDGLVLPSRHTTGRRIEVIPSQRHTSSSGTFFSLPVSSSLRATRISDKDTEKEKSPATADDGISEVDARVLQSMLQDGKVDLDEEKEVRRLLERGIRKEVQAPQSAAARGNNESNNNDSDFSSTIFRKLSDTVMWKKFQRVAEDFADSAKLFVANRVERDAALLAALGLFAWDRAVRDVARALPAASSMSKKAVNTLLLSATSSFKNETVALKDVPFSFKEDDNAKTIFEEMNTPMDEIKTVTDSIRAILLNEPTTTSSAASQRGLRTAAPAGRSGASRNERLKKAYAWRKRKQEQEKNVARTLGQIPTAVVDSAYEMQRDFKAEQNQPGYKTKKVRTAIAAGAAAAPKILGAVKKNLALGAERRKQYVRQLKQADQFKTQTVNELRMERSFIVQRLDKCIGQPEETWLRPEYVEMVDNHAHFSEDGIRQLVRKMVKTRDEIEKVVESPDEQQQSFADLIEQLRNINTSVGELHTFAEEAVSTTAATALRDCIMGFDQSQYQDIKNLKNVPIMLRLDEIENVATVEEPQLFSFAEPTLLEAAEGQDIHSSESSNSYVEVEMDVDNNDYEQIVDESFESSVFLETDQEEKSNNRFNFFSKRDTNTQSESKKDEIRSVKADLVVDAVPESVVIDNTFSSRKVNNHNNIQDVLVTGTSSQQVNGNTAAESTMDSLYAEVITDDDFDDVVGQKTKGVKVVSNYDGEDDESAEKEKNIVLDIVLRSLDVVFFVVEKTFFVALPKAISSGKLAAERFEKVSRSGLGSKGWERIANANEGAKRY